MKTIISKRIQTKTHDVEFGYWNMETEEFVPIAGMTEEETQVVADLFGCTPLLVDALAFFSDLFRSAVEGDLKDIWKLIELKE